jgi:thermitase
VTVSLVQPGLFRRLHLAALAALVLSVVLGLGAPRADAAYLATFPSNELLVRFHDGGVSLPAYRAYERVASGLALIHGRGLRAQELTRSGQPLAVLAYSNPAAAALAMRDLQRDPSVAVVEPNITRQLTWEPTDTNYADQLWWLQRVSAPQAWDITTGSETVIVAVIDSGVSPTHPDLVGRLVPGYNAVDGSNNTADISGHGTHVAGIIAAQGTNAVGTAGVAMDVRIMPIRVVDDAGEIRVANEIDAIYWAVDNGAQVINLSLGSDEYVQLEREAIQYARNHGVVVVASAGNSVGRISYPAHYEETISVGSLRADGQPSSFTSRLTRVDLSAPGESIYSPGWDAFFGDYWDDVFYSDFRPVTGTSFSTAIVTGAVALVKSVAPEYGTEQVRGVLTGTATPISPSGPVAGTGAGQLNVEAAVRNAVYGAMHATWHTTDNPVASGAVSRTWLWGEGPVTWAYEPYQEAQNGVRLVYYFDKSRMEVTDPHHDRSHTWYVTNGLLVNELITGQMQTGDARFQQRAAAGIGVAGDPDDVSGPLYSSFANLLSSPPIAQGEIILLTIDRQGRVSADSRLAAYNVTAAVYVGETRHRVASVFWDYLNSSGLIASGDTLVNGQLFDPWFYATGYPVTEAYWSQVKVRGVVRDVLVQCFERRCLTYTPSNDPGWQVEMGNVGQHYHAWRYSSTASGPHDPSAQEVRRPASIYEPRLGGPY